MSISSSGFGKPQAHAARAAAAAAKATAVAKTVAKAAAVAAAPTAVAATAAARESGIPTVHRQSAPGPGNGEKDRYSVDVGKVGGGGCC